MAIAQSNAARQRKHRCPVRGSVARLDVEIPVEVAAKLRYRAHHWGGTRRAAVARLLMDAWEREGRPIPDMTRTAIRYRATHATRSLTGPGLPARPPLGPR